MARPGLAIGRFLLSKVMRRGLSVLLLIAGGGLAAGAGILLVRDRHFRSELDLAKRELGHRRPKQAKDLL
jgi:hypothetical protein